MTETTTRVRTAFVLNYDGGPVHEICESLGRYEEKRPTLYAVPRDEIGATWTMTPAPCASCGETQDVFWVGWCPTEAWDPRWDSVAAQHAPGCEWVAQGLAAARAGGVSS